MLKALVHADQFRFDATLKTWLVSIAMNEVRQVYRCKWSTHSVSLRTENVESDRFPVVQSPNAGYQVREREVLLRQAVSRLPEPYRCVIELRDRQCLPLMEARSRSAVAPVRGSRFAIALDFFCRQDATPASAKEIVSASVHLEVLNRRSYIE